VIRYAHTNLVARDWRALAAFYCDVFGCTPRPPERTIDAPWLARGTGVANARLRGIHLNLPGHGDRGPTLEIFEYLEQLERPPGTLANRPGFTHIAFEVDDVAAARARVLAAGGSDVGEMVTAAVDGAGTITFTYVADPEGNIIELQTWS
jgi:catechol 2,3-dioxygenase-like lactoylglutathione lyase family enzyme